MVGQGWVSPSEFWSMPPGEVWWLVDAKTPKESADYDALYQAMIDAQAEEQESD